MDGINFRYLVLLSSGVSLKLGRYFASIYMEIGQKELCDMNVQIYMCKHVEHEHMMVLDVVIYLLCSVPCGFEEENT